METEVKTKSKIDPEEFIYVIKPTKSNKKQTKKKKGMRGNKKRFLQLLPDRAFNISKVCRELNLNRSTFYDWMEKDPKFKQIYDELQERIIDIVENSLMQQIAEKNTTATIFFLKTKAKNRGYVERIENVQIQDTKLEVIWADEDNTKQKADTSTKAKPEDN